ncbi:MAG TPA: PQQ-binding-like beta-propeller repeat protein [Pyrinomonadaceae bacterium]|nr:PQQ-binding-like beta-propeller repeat protein [Pyrinomonadaceae bacterium]
MRFRHPLSLRRIAPVTALCVCLLSASSAADAQTGTSGRKGSTRRPAARKITPASQTKTRRAQAGGAQAREVSSSILVRWTGQPGIERYRLQLATDEGFQDIVFDEAVVGRQYVVRTLPKGRYFWRVAPAVGETGAFSSPARVEAEAPAGVDEASVMRPPLNTGWRTATGDVEQPVPARLRAGKGFDLLGVNADGTVFALDGTNGFALWTARYSPGAARTADTAAPPVALTPAIFRAEGERTRVVVGFTEGVRALDGETGRELWRARLAGSAANVSALDADGDGREEVVLLTADPAALYVVEPATGRVVSETKLDAAPHGAPALLVREKERGLLIALRNNMLELRGATGALLGSAKFDTTLTTPPLPLATPRGQIIVVGTEGGIVALKTSDLAPLGRISTHNDAPRGTLTAADLDDDGAAELIVVTKGGRVAVVSTIDGNTKWFADGASDAASAAVADLNSDGVLDVLVAAGPNFARGFSGRDGRLIWKAEEESGRHASTAAPPARGYLPRSLAIATTEDGGAVVVGTDPARTGLRAVELPRGSVKTAAR